jgi:hypothetical protein
MHPRTIVTMGVALLALTASACGSAGGPSPLVTASPTATPTPAATPTPVPTPTPSASPAGLQPLEVRVPSLGIDVTGMTPLTCGDTSVQTRLPASAEVDFVDCGSSLVQIIGNQSGPLAPLTTAPVGTQIQWANASGALFHTSTAGAPNTQQRDPSSGEYPGHGIPYPIGDFLVRNSTQQVEVYGPLTSG